MQAKVADRKLIIFFDARVDTKNAVEVEREIENFVSANKNLPVEFDAENLEYISSVGLRILLKFRKRLNHNITVKNVSKEVAEVFETSGFTKFFDVQKKLRRVAIENLQKIGQGSTGAVYKLDDENILKVYNENWTLEDVQFERENSQKAFLGGLDTAIAYDVVKVENNFGIVYEMLNADTLEKIISDNPEQTEMYARKFAEFVKRQHEIEFDGISSKEKRIELSYEVKKFDSDTQKIIERFLKKVPERKNFSHGDLNLSNVIVQGEDFLMIDMGEISCGHQIFDLSWIYFMYEIRQRQGKNVMGPAVMPKTLWQTFSQEYFNTKDAESLKHFERELFPYAMIQLLLSAAKRDVPQRAIDHYSTILKQMGLPQPIDF